MKAEASVDYLAELKRLVLLHTRAQGLTAADCSRVLARIQRDGADGPGSWVQVWRDSGDDRAAAGDHLAASAAYNIARFPFIDSHERRQAMQACSAAFARWAEPQGMTRLAVTVDGRRFVVWVATPDTPTPRPVLLVMGGIVSVKEQWGPILAAAGRLGMTVAVTEMPGVGENELVHGPESPRMLTIVLDAIAKISPGDRAYCLAFSFGGHLALCAALRDERIRGVATVGAPVSEFFRSAQWWESLPQTTLRTLAHVARRTGPELQDEMSRMALDPEQLASLTIPVRYVASERDEIIPTAEVALLQRWCPNIRVLTHNDVHGSPDHLLSTRTWLLRSVLGMQSGKGLTVAALTVAFGMAQVRSKLRRVHR